MPVRPTTDASTPLRLIRAATMLALTAALAGCVSDGNSGPSNAYAQMGGGAATVLFHPGVSLGSRAVEHHQLMPAPVFQVPRHRIAHHPKPDPRRARHCCNSPSDLPFSR